MRNKNNHKNCCMNMLYVAILISLILSCFGFKTSYNNESILRNKRQTVECKGKFLCNSGTKCISLKQTCNGVKDCPDGSDENPEDCNISNPQTNGSCSPFVVENGRFAIVGGGYEPGTLIPNYVLVQIFCNSNYFLHPNTPLLACLDGVWNNPAPQCKPKCEPRISSTAQVNCTLNDEAVDCNEPMSEGTISISTCKTFYTPTFSNISISTCIDGYWDNPLIPCEPECGDVIPDGVIYLISGEDTKRGEFPWLVGIYRFTDKYELQCGGSIISPTVVLTVAHCVTAYDTSEPYPPDRYFIGAGKYYNEYDNVKDVFAQKRQVKEFFVPEMFKGDHNNYIADIAIAVVKERFEMTNVVRPVCVDFSNEFEAEQLKDNSFGSIAGWGYQNTDSFSISPYLQQLKIPYINTTECLQIVPSYFLKYVTSEKYCAGYRNGSSACKGDSGNGMVFERTVNNKGKFFIRGILSLGVAQRGICDSTQPSLYTKVSTYLDFIRNVFEKQEPEIYTCQPRISNTVDVICTLNGETVDCKERMKGGTIAVSKCKDLYVMTHKQNTTATCMNGFWNNPPLRCVLLGQQRQKRACPARTLDSVNIKCLYNDNPINCNELLPDGSIVISECKNFYTPKKSQNSVSISKCFNGKWTTPLIECEQIKPIKIECGEVISKGVINSINTEISKRGEFPWHIGIYRHSTSKYSYTCGGSIVTTNIVLTAAHCLTDEYGNRFPAEEFFVAAGKYYSDYNALEDKLAQKRQVMEYHTPPIYKGYETNFAGDIAVVVIKQSFELNTAVQPVCVEWDDKIESQQLKPDNRGSIVGWGSVDPFDITRVSKELKQLNAPYVDVKQCLRNVPQNFRRWVTTDKFCAGYTNGSSVCKGDSGGGMVFEWRSNQTQKYFIRGIVSVGPSDTKKSLICDNFKYGAYTLVSFYSKFILDIIRQYHD